MADPCASHTSRAYLEDVLQRNAPSAGAKLLFACTAGSQSYNVCSGASDNDFLGVYVAPLGDVLALHPRHAETLTKSTEVDDYTLHEVAKFARLLLKGNPGIVEALYNDHDAYTTEAWRALVAHRSSFLSQSVVHHYIGFVRAQLSQYKKSKVVKKLYHVVRLLGEIDRIVAGGEPRVRMVGDERDRLMRIRAGDCNPGAILDEADTRIAAVLAAEPWNLPAQGDADLLARWLVDVRQGRLALE